STTRLAFRVCGRSRKNSAKKKPISVLRRGVAVLTTPVCKPLCNTARLSRTEADSDSSATSKGNSFKSRKREQDWRKRWILRSRSAALIRCLLTSRRTTPAKQKRQICSSLGGLTKDLPNESEKSSRNAFTMRERL